MILNERQTHILKILRENKSVNVKTLAKTLYVSEATVRRDLNSKPPVELVVCTYPRRVRLPAHPSTGIEVWQRITISGSRYVAAVFFCLLILDTRKRVYVLAYADLVCHSVIL